MKKDEFSATVTSKGQVTIPIYIREKLGIKEGDQIMFTGTRHSEIKVKRLREKETPSFFGSLKPKAGIKLTQEDLDNSIAEYLSKKHKPKKK